MVDVVNELEGRLNDVRATLSVQDRSLEAASAQMGDGERFDDRPT